MDINAFFKISYGLYIVSSHDGDKLNGHISNTVFQVTADPPRFAVATHKDNLTTEMIRKSKVFSVSVLQKDVDLEFLGPWGFRSGHDIDKFAGCNYTTGISGAPVLLDKSIAYIDCELEQEVDTGTHILFIGRAVDARVLDNKAIPLTYTYYREVIKGLSPEHAPTYTDPSAKLESEEIMSDKKMKKFRCLVCGYLYDPAEGDPTKGIPPGTSFDELPDDWTCPICNVGKEEFKETD